jgi:hypothetical protein
MGYSREFTWISWDSWDVHGIHGVLMGFMGCSWDSWGVHGIHGAFMWIHVNCVSLLVATRLTHCMQMRITKYKYTAGREPTCTNKNIAHSHRRRALLTDSSPRCRIFNCQVSAHTQVLEIIHTRCQATTAWNNLQCWTIHTLCLLCAQALCGAAVHCKSHKIHTALTRIFTLTNIAAPFMYGLGFKV